MILTTSSWTSTRTNTSTNIFDNIDFDNIKLDKFKHLDNIDFDNIKLDKYKHLGQFALFYSPMLEKQEYLGKY